MSNPTYKPSESKREEFRKYLEKNGVMDALTKVLVNLYEETQKPEDALEYIRDKLAMLAGLETYKELSKRLEETEDRVKQLEVQLQEGGSDIGAPSVPAVKASSIAEPTVASSRASAAQQSAIQQPAVEESAESAQQEEAAPEAPAEAPAEEPAPEAEAPPPEESQ